MKTDTKNQTFSELIKGDKPVLVDFYADWCGPCKAMSPIVKEVKKRMGDEIIVIKVDTDRNPAAAIKYNVRGVPTLILFYKGNVLWQQAGVVQAGQLESIIRSHLDTV